MGEPQLCQSQAAHPSQLPPWASLLLGAEAQGLGCHSHPQILAIRATYIPVTSPHLVDIPAPVGDPDPSQIVGQGKEGRCQACWCDVAPCPTSPDVSGSALGMLCR